MRAVLRLPKVAERERDFIWEYQHHDQPSAAAVGGGWVAYPAPTMEMIETDFTSGCTPCKLSPKHTIDFLRMVQQRTDSGRAGRGMYSVRRRPPMVFPQVQIVEIYENERRVSPVSGWSSASLYSVERPQWSTEDGSKLPVIVQLDWRALPPPGGDGWRWLTDDWSIDAQPRTTDADGWQYAGNWIAKAWSWAVAPSPMRFVRRRRHIRLQQLGSTSDAALRHYKYHVRQAPVAPMWSATSHTVNAAAIAAPGVAGSADQGGDDVGAEDDEPDPDNTGAELCELGPEPETEPEPEPSREHPRWMRSHESACCMLCQRAFGFTIPKHHCRSCGFTVCGSCSASSLVLERWLLPNKPHTMCETRSAEPLRVCDICYQSLEPQSLDAKPVVEPLAEVVPQSMLLTVPLQASMLPSVPVSAVRSPTELPEPESEPPRLLELEPQPRSAPHPLLARLKARQSGAQMPAAWPEGPIIDRKTMVLLEGVRTPGGQSAAMLAARCWKQRPTLRIWLERYVVLDGSALKVFDSESAFRKDLSSFRGSSIMDLTGFEVQKGRPGRLGPSLVLRHDVYEYGSAAFQFESEDVRDEFFTACQNVSANLSWDHHEEPPVDAAVSRNSAVVEMADPADGQAEWQPPALSPMLRSAEVLGELAVFFLHETAGSTERLANYLLGGCSFDAAGNTVRLTKAESLELHNAAWQRVVHHIGSPWRAERDAVLETLAAGSGKQLQIAMQVDPAQHAEVVRALHHGSTPAWVLAALRRPFARALSTRKLNDTGETQRLGSDESLTAGLIDTPFRARAKVSLRSLTIGKDLLQPMLAQLGPLSMLAYSVHVELELTDGSKTSWTSAPTTISRESNRAVWQGKGSRFCLPRIPCAVVGMQCAIFCESNAARVKVGSTKLMRFDGTDPLEGHSRRIAVHIAHETPEDSMDVGLAAETGRGGLRRGVSSPREEDTTEQDLGQFLKMGAAKLAKSLQETHEELLMFIDDLDDVGAAAAGDTMMDSILRDAPETSELSLNISCRASSLGAECSPSALEFQFQSCMLAVGSALREQDRKGAAKALNQAEILKAEIDDASGHSECLDEIKPARDVHLYVATLVSIIDFYAQRVFKHGEGWDLVGSDNESDGDGGEPPSMEQPAAEHGDETEIFSPPVRIGREDSAVSASSLDEWEVIRQNSNEAAGAECRTQKFGHRWPLALICPWRYQYLFADMADGVGVYAGSQSDRLYQAAALLHAFPTGRIPPTYLQALQGVLGEAAKADDVTTPFDGMPLVQDMHQAVSRLAEHALVNSFVQYSTSYPLDSMDSGALEMALQIVIWCASHAGAADINATIKAQLEKAAAGLGRPLLQESRNMHHFSSGVAEQDISPIGDPAEVECLIASCTEVCGALIEFSNIYAPIFASVSSLTTTEATETLARPVYTELCTLIRHLLEHVQPVCYELILSELLVQLAMVNESLGAVTQHIELLDIDAEFTNITTSCIEAVALKLSTWSVRAIEVDDWTPINSLMGSRHSSSVQDILEACTRSVESLQVALFNADFAMLLASRMGAAVESYAVTVVDVFRNDLEASRPGFGTIRDASAEVQWDAIAVKLNNLWQAAITFGDLGEKLVSLHELLNSHGIIAWEECRARLGPLGGWKHLVENFDNDLTPAAGDSMPESSSGPSKLADELDNCVLRLNKTFVGACDDACRIIFTDLIRTEIVHIVLVCEEQRTSFMAEPWAEVINWLSVELEEARKHFYDYGLSRFVRGLMVELEELLINLLLGESFADMMQGLADETLSEAGYSQIVEHVDGITVSFLRLFSSLRGSDAQGQLMKQKSVDNRFGEHSRVVQLLELHQSESSLLRASLADVGTRLSGDAEKLIYQSDMLQVLNMRKVFDAGAKSFLVESGITHQIRPPSAHELDASETVLGTFSCWSPVRGTLHITTGHLLFEPHVLKEKNRKKIQIDEIKFLKKQKMTLIGSDICLEVGVAAAAETAADTDIVLFRGFFSPFDRDRCQEMICQSSLATFGRSLVSSEEGEWPQLRTMFGLPWCETMLSSWSCSAVQRSKGQSEVKPNGTLYLTEHFVCFHSYFFGARHQDVIKLTDISIVEKSSYPTLVPNAIDMFTKNPGRRVTFFGFGFGLDRNRAYVEIGQATRFARTRASAEGELHEMLATSQDVMYSVTVFYDAGATQVPVQLVCTLDGELGSSGPRETTLRHRHSPSHTTTHRSSVHEFVVQCSALGQLRSCRVSVKEGENKEWLRAIAMVGVAGSSTAPPAICVHQAIVAAAGAADVGSAYRSSETHATGASISIFDFGGRPVVVGGAPAQCQPLSADETFDAAAAGPADSMRLVQEDELYENQRRPALTLRAAAYSSDALARTEREAWTDDSGNRPVFKQSINSSLPQGWGWSTDWAVDIVEGQTDPEGWRYAFNWPSSGQPSSLPSLARAYYAVADAGCFVRRRLWVRQRTRQIATPRIALNVVSVVGLPPNGHSDYAFSRVVARVRAPGAEAAAEAVAGNARSATAAHWSAPARCLTFDVNYGGASSAAEAGGGSVEVALSRRVDGGNYGSGPVQVLHALCTCRLPLAAIPVGGGLIDLWVRCDSGTGPGPGSPPSEVLMMLPAETPSTTTDPVVPCPKAAGPCIQLQMSRSV